MQQHQQQQQKVPEVERSNVASPNKGKIKSVLLQVRRDDSQSNSVVELSPEQDYSLGSPAVVSLERMSTPVTSLKALVKKAKAQEIQITQRLICEVKVNPDVPYDGCRLNSNALHVIGSLENECVRLSLLEPRVGMQSNEDCKNCLQLQHERDHYQKYAEHFRSELSVAVNELEQANEERQVVVSMYTKSILQNDDLKCMQFIKRD